MNLLREEIKVLFVCLGNICRSPLAEGIFKNYITQQGLGQFFYLDSAGTSDYHVGAAPDQRALSIAADYGIVLQHCARQFKPDDFQNFDYILVMDHLNYDAVLGLAASLVDQKKVFLLRTFDAQSIDFFDVPDPYYGAVEDFQEVSEIVWRSSQGFVKFLIKAEQLDSALLLRPPRLT